MSNNRLFAGVILFFLHVTCLSAQEKVQPKLMVTVGHAGVLIDADFSPDGTKVVSASFDNYEVNHIIVWDVLSGNIITIIEDDQEVISTGEGSFCNINVAFSQSGNRVITTDEDNSFTIWDASSGEKIFYGDQYDKVILNDKKDKIITFSGNPYSDEDINIKVWDAETGALLDADNITLQNTDQYKSRHSRISLNFNDPYLIGIINDRLILWNSDLKLLINEKSTHNSYIIGHNLTSDGKYLVTYTSKDICIWDLVKFKLVKKINPNLFSEFRILISKDNERLLLYSELFYEKKIYISCFDLSTGDLVDNILNIEIKEFIYNYYEYSHFSDILTEIINDLGHENNSDYSYLIDENTKSYLIGKIISRGDSIVELWDGESNYMYYGGVQTKFNTLKYSTDGRSVLLYKNDAYGESNRQIVVLDAKTLELITTLEGKVNQLKASWLSSSGKRLFIQTRDGFHVWNTEEGKIIYKTPFTDNLFFTNDENKFAFITNEGIEIRDVNTGKLLIHINKNDINGILSSFRRLIFSDDGSRIAIITDEGIEIRDVNTGILLEYIKIGDTTVFSGRFEEFSFSNDGHRFAIQTEQGVEVRDINSGKLFTYTYKNPEISYQAVTFSSNGKLVALSSKEKIDVIDLETGQLKKTLLLPKPNFSNGRVNIVCFSPDDKLLLTAYAQGDFSDPYGTLWDLERDSLTKTLEYCQIGTFTEDSKKLITTPGWGDQFFIWDTQTGALIDTVHFYDIGLDTSAKVISKSWIDAHSRFFRKSYLYEIPHTPVNYKGDEWSIDKLYTTLITGENNMVHLYDIKAGKLLYSLVTVDSSDYLILHPDGYYDGTEAARNLLYFVCNGEVIDLAQVKDALYVPGLHEKIMTGQPINYKKLSELDICDALPVVKSLDDTKYHYQVKPRRLGLERVEVYVNDKRVRSLPANELKNIEGSYDITLDEKELSSHFMSGIDNKVKVVGVARSEFGSELLSRGVVKTASGFKAKTVPRLFAVMIGINEYKDPSLRLNYPVKDALDLGRVLEASAVKMLGRENVFFYPINSDVKPGTGFDTPEKEGIRKALEDIGRKARPEDVVFLFFAGHGQMQGEDGKVFTFLTADASQLNPVGISTKELQEWLSYEGPHKMLANKTILIFDACNSGQATAELLAMARTDDETRRLRQVEDLKDKSGMFILAGAAPNQSAYELQQYEHGLLTYSLLSVMKNNPEILEDSIYLNLQKWFLDTEKTLKNLADKEGLKQDAKPLGTANIRMGIVDKEITDQIVLVYQKPKVYCDNVLDIETLGDDLLLKDKINSSLSAISERDGSGELLFTPRVTPDVCRINISYQIQGDNVTAKLRLIKGTETLHQTNITGSKKDLDGLVKMIVKEVREHAR